MKLTGFFMLLSVASLFATNSYSQSKAINLNLESSTVKRVLQEIEEQSDFHFMYSEEIVDVQRKVSVTADNKKILEVLDDLFAGTSVSYKVKDRFILLSDSEGKAVEVQQQVKTVTGKVVDNKGEVLPGVTVIVKGTTIGTITDIDGKYSITNVSENDILYFSFVGMISQEVAVGNQTNINIAFAEDAIGIEEVVAVGYGSQKKATLSGAVETVDEKVFLSRAVANPIQSLQGQTPGVVVTRTSSRPGNINTTTGASDENDVTIRGMTSINNSDVLYVIDGIISEKTEFNNMNQSDIASISVLKDGAAAIYGSRAANGVLMITTKKGSGKMTVEYGGNYSFKKIGRMPAVPTMSEYAQVFLEGVQQEGDGNYKQWASEQNLLDMIDEKAGWYQTAVSGWGVNGLMYMEASNRFDDMYGDAHSQQHNVAVSGSTDVTKYRISGNFAEDVGASKVYDGQKQYTFRVNLDQKLTDWLSTDIGLSHQSIKTERPTTGFQADAVNNDPPVFPAKNPYGDWYANFGIGNKNSIAQTTEGGKSYVDNRITKINLGVTAQITGDLEFRGIASYMESNRTYDATTLSVLLYGWDDNDPQQSVNPNSSIKSRYNEAVQQLYTGYLTYTKTFKKDHNFKAMGGVTAELNESSWIEASRDGISDLGVFTVNLGTGVQTNDAAKSNYGFYSYFGRFNYDYKNRYMVELLGRSDGTSKFSEGNKWQAYFGASAGWILSEESFLKDISFLSFLKLKGSWAEMGNLPGSSVISNHSYASEMNFSTTVFGVTPSPQATARVNGIVSDNRTWERVQMTNIGTEFGFLDQKIYGSFDYFKKDNPNMLASQQFTALLGGEAPAENIGHLRTKGWEIMLGIRGKVGNDFTYGVAVNMGNSKNKLLSLTSAASWVAGYNDPDDNEFREDYPIGSYWMYETNGLFQTQEQVDAWYTEIGDNGGSVPKQSSANALRPGDIIKVDRDDNDQILGVSADGGDLKYMGDSDPHYVFGINTDLSWKNIDFSCSFQGHLEQNVERTGLLSYPFYRHWANLTPAFIGTQWTEQNPENTNPRATSSATRAAYNWANNDFRLQNSRYVRLKTLIVGYTFPAALTRKMKMKNLRVYFSGNDLWEWTSLDDGYDPENGASTQSAYPFMRSYAFGISAKF
ncbi:TonB-dependent receptor [Mangrovibacterium sp.]|uniref:TonB-dependent receptor n=1 Tax=Mangrovibacterium sp. TaxID=1961364 RepID=UPI003567DEDB